jgi:hypothetical protein
MIPDDIIESLAEYAHKAWSGWMQYLFKHGKFNKDGSFTISAKKVSRWLRQKDTPYNDLPGGEKESDRKEARQILEIVGRFYDI